MTLPQSVTTPLVVSNTTTEYDLNTGSNNNCMDRYIYCNNKPFANPNRPVPQMHERYGDIVGLPQLDGGIASGPSLFLQEWCHLASLLNAVALGTLRTTDFCTNEQHYLPMCEYLSGAAEWPPADSHFIDVREGYYCRNHRTTGGVGSLFCYWYQISDTLQYWLGLNRGPEYTKKYMEAVPLPGWFLYFFEFLFFEILDMKLKILSDSIFGIVLFFFLSFKK